MIEAWLAPRLARAREGRVAFVVRPGEPVPPDIQALLTSYDVGPVVLDTGGGLDELHLRPAALASPRLAAATPWPTGPRSRTR